MSEVTGPGGVVISTMAPNHDIKSAIQLWYGRPKIGKTSTAAALGTVSEEYGLDIKPFFFLFESGSGGVTLNGTQQKCPDCAGKKSKGKGKCPTCSGEGVVRLVLRTIEEIEEWFDWFAKSPFNIGVIDTVDTMFQVVTAGVCKLRDVSSPAAANDNGVTWMLISDAMRELLAKPRMTGKGLILIMHSQQVEKRVKNGTVSTTTFGVSGKSKGMIEAMANQILYFDVVGGADGDEHVAFAKPQSGIEAGDQWGLFPEEVKLGKTAKDAAEAILTCFGLLEEGK